MLVEEVEKVVGEEVAGNIWMNCICIFKECIKFCQSWLWFNLSTIYNLLVVVVVVVVKEAVDYLAVYLVVEARRRRHTIKILNQATRNKNIGQWTKEVIQGKKINIHGPVKRILITFYVLKLGKSLSIFSIDLEGMVEVIKDMEVQA